jgi:hypothetical protein
MNNTDLLYKQKYLKYKSKYIELKNLQKGGGLAALAILGIGALSAKRLLQCPFNEKSERNKDTGLISKIGKEDIRKRIRKNLNYPKIKNDPKFQEKIINKLKELNITQKDLEDENVYIPSNITLVDLKNTLQDVAFDTSTWKKTGETVSRLGLTMSGLTNAKTKKQMYVDEVVSYLDCACNERGVTMTGLVAQSAQNVRNIFASKEKREELDKSRGKVDVRCLLGLTDKLPLPKEDNPLFTVSELESCDPNDENCKICKENVSYDTEILDNNTAVITAIYPDGGNCLKQKIN